MAFLFTSPKFQAFDANGDPLAGGKVFTYDAGTTTPRATYTDQSGGTPNANPVILDAAGTAHIWLDGEAYKFVVTDSADVAAPFGTVDNIQLQEPDTDTIFGVDTVAAMKAYTGSASSIRTLGYYTKGDGGAAVYWHDSSDAVSADNGGTIIVRSDGARMKLIVEGEYIPSKQLGIKGDSVTGETAKVSAGITMARDVGKGLLIQGRPLLDTQLVIGAPISVEFEGQTGDGAAYAANSMPTSFFIVPPTQPSGQSALIVEHPGVVFRGGGLVCPLDSGHASTRYAYDGLSVHGHGFIWEYGLIFGFGRDGVRIGTLSGGGVRNSSRAHFKHCRSMWNGGKGFHVSDDDGDIDANTFHLDNCLAQFNVAQGYYFNKCLFGGVVTAMLSEHNGTGLYIEDNCRDIVFIGGDVELNDGPSGGGALTNVVLAGRAAYRNTFLGLIYQDNAAPSTAHRLNAPNGLRGTYLPELIGSAVRGALTYPERRGWWTYDGEMLTVGGEFTATVGPTGIPAGGLEITMPELPGFPGVSYRSIDPTTVKFSRGIVTWDQNGANPLPALATASIVGHVYVDLYPLRMGLFCQNAGTTGTTPVAPALVNNDWIDVIFLAHIPINLSAVRS